MNARRRRRDFLRPLVEWLEPRRLLACEVFVRDQMLFVIGDEADNFVEIVADGRSLAVTCDGVAAGPFTGVAAVLLALGPGRNGHRFDAEEALGAGALKDTDSDGLPEIVDAFGSVAFFEFISGAGAQRFDIGPGEEPGSIQMDVADADDGFHRMRIKNFAAQDVRLEAGGGDDTATIDNRKGLLSSIEIDVFGQGGFDYYYWYSKEFEIEDAGTQPLGVSKFDGGEGDDTATFVGADPNPPDNLLTQALLAEFLGGPGNDKLVIDGTATDRGQEFDISPGDQPGSAQIEWSDIGTGLPLAEILSVDVESIAVRGSSAGDLFRAEHSFPADLFLVGRGGSDEYEWASPHAAGVPPLHLSIEASSSADRVEDSHDLVRIIGTPFDDLIEVVGVPDPQGVDPLIRIDVPSIQLTAELSIVGAEAITVDSRGGGDRIVMRELTARLSDVDWTIATGPGNDIVDARMDLLPDVLHVELSSGNDRADIQFVASANFPPGPVRETPADIQVHAGAGVNAVTIDVFSSLPPPPPDIIPQITLIEVLAAIHVSGVGLLALLTLFPLGAMEMAQSIQDDRTGHAKTEAAIAIDGANLAIDLTTGATQDTVLLDLAPLPSSQVGLNLNTGRADDRIEVQSKSPAGPLDWTLDVAPGSGIDEVLVAFEHGDVESPIVIGALWNSMGAEAQKSVSEKSAKMTIAAAHDAAKASLYSTFIGSAGRDDIQLDAQLARSSGDIEIDLDWETGLGDDEVTMNLETAADHVIQKVRTDLGGGDDQLFASEGRSRLISGFGQTGETDSETYQNVNSTYGGLGNDIVDITVEAAADLLDERRTIDSGPGDDRVSVNIPAVQIDGLADLIVGTGPGAGPHVKAFDGGTQAEVQSFFAYDPSFAGGVRVAAGDVNGDGVSDIITGAGPGAGPHVKVFDGRTHAELYNFFAYGAGFAGGVFVAAGDMNGDGRDDIITGAGAGAAGGHVKVFDGRTGAEVRSFFALDPSFSGGVTVAGGDVNGDGQADIVVGAGPGAPGGHVKVFDGRTHAELASFFAYPGFTGGVFVAAGDVNGDGRADIVTGADADQQTAGGHVKVFDGATGAEFRSFFAYDANFTGGVRVAAGDVNGDGRADIVTGAGPGAAGGHVKVFDGLTGSELSSFFSFDPSFAGGVFVVAGDLHSSSLPQRLDLDLAIDTAGGADVVDLNLAQTATADLLENVQITTGGGADRVSVLWVKLPLKQEFPGGLGDQPERIALDLAIDTAASADTVDVRLEGGLADERLQEVQINTGDGADVVRTQLLQPLEFQDDIEFPRDVQSDLSIDMGAGNDRAEAELQPHGTAADNLYSFQIQLGGGRDIAKYWIFGTELPPSGPNDPPAVPLGRFDFAVLGEAGNDDIQGRVGLARDGQLLPLAMADARLTIDGGGGRDRLSLDYRGAILDPAAVDLILRGGAGDDQVRARLDLDPASTGELSVQVLGDDGHDELGLAVLNADNLKLLVALLDGGRGKDRCRTTPNVMVVNCP